MSHHCRLMLTTIACRATTSEQACLPTEGEPEVCRAIARPARRASSALTRGQRYAARALGAPQLDLAERDVALLTQVFPGGWDATDLRGAPAPVRRWPFMRIEPSRAQRRRPCASPRMHRVCAAHY